MDNINSIFTYGTLRADYNINGDVWGVIDSVTDDCDCYYGKVHGYKLYQDRRLSYPFITPTYDNNDIVYGTLLEWNVEDGNNNIFLDKLKRCDEIEGFNRNNPLDGLYNRCIVEVIKLKKTKNLETNKCNAYIYYQNIDNVILETCDYYKSGDWLSSVK